MVSPEQALKYEDPAKPPKDLAAKSTPESPGVSRETGLTYALYEAYQARHVPLGPDYRHGAARLEKVFDADVQPVLPAQDPALQKGIEQLELSAAIIDQLIAKPPNYDNAYKLILRLDLPFVASHQRMLDDGESQNVTPDLSKIGKLLNYEVSQLVRLGKVDQAFAIMDKIQTGASKLMTDPQTLENVNHVAQALLNDKRNADPNSSTQEKQERYGTALRELNLAEEGYKQIRDERGLLRTALQQGNCYLQLTLSGNHHRAEAHEKFEYVQANADKLADDPLSFPEAGAIAVLQKQLAQLKGESAQEQGAIEKKIEELSKLKEEKVKKFKDGMDVIVDSSSWSNYHLGLSKSTIIKIAAIGIGVGICLASGGSGVLVAAGIVDAAWAGTTAMIAVDAGTIFAAGVGTTYLGSEALGVPVTRASLIEGGGLALAGGTYVYTLGALPSAMAPRIAGGIAGFTSGNVYALTDMIADSQERQLSTDDLLRIYAQDVGISTVAGIIAPLSQYRGFARVPGAAGPFLPKLANSWPIVISPGFDLASSYLSEWGRSEIPTMMPPQVKWQKPAD